MPKSLIAVAGVAAAASAQVVNIDARIHCSGAGGAATLALDAGTYLLVPVSPPEGDFTAWNAWGSVSGCDPSGAGCTTGWIFGYYAVAGELEVSLWKGAYETPELAFAEAVPRRLRLCEPATVRFYVGDSQCGDNQGGVSLRVEPDPCPADVDLSGSLDFFDFLAFQNQFAAENPAADVDCSGDLDFFDFLAFQNLFAAGC